MRMPAGRKLTPFQIFASGKLKRSFSEPTSYVKLLAEKIRGNFVN